MKKPVATLYVVVPFLAAFLSSPIYARTWHVFADGSGDAPTIQAAIDDAQADDVILVGPGDYYESLTILKDLGLGADRLTIEGTQGAGATTVHSVNGYRHVAIYSWAGTTIRGLTFCGGRGLEAPGQSSGDESEDGEGGSMWIRGAATTVEDCVFVDNEALAGGAIYAENETGRSVFQRNLFVNNRALGNTGPLLQGGGAIFAMGPETDVVVFANNTFYRNVSSSAGGAIVVRPFFPATTNITNCLFVRNSATGGNVIDNQLGSIGVAVSCLGLWNNSPGDALGAGFLVDSPPLVADPMMCYPDGMDFTLADGSPFLPGANTCGLVGAYGLGCAAVPVQPTTWGNLKQKFVK